MWRGGGICASGGVAATWLENPFCSLAFVIHRTHGCVVVVVVLVYTVGVNEQQRKLKSVCRERARGCCLLRNELR